MYIIYCEHIFVYIFPCYFNWDSSFVTEVFPRKKQRKKKKKVPCELRHFVTAPSVWGAVGERKTFLTDLHWKAKMGKGRESNFVPNLDRPLWCIHQPAQSTGEDFQILAGYHSEWLRWWTNQKSDSPNLPAGGVSSFPSLNTGPTGGKPNAVRLLKPQRTEEKMTGWKVSQPAAAESQYPASRLSAFSFLTLLHWLRVRSP